MKQVTIACFYILLALFTYRQAAPGYHYQFPRDHFEHADYKDEWWYYTGNLTAADGHKYGFELVFFRLGNRDKAGTNPSVWRVDDLYMAHVALTDADGRDFRYFQRFNRAGPGIAGASYEQGRIWNGNWKAVWDKKTGAQTLTAVADGVRFTLRLRPEKPPVIHGENGVSRKSEEAGYASHYVSFTRLRVEGEMNGSRVAGIAWMDHEWFSNLLSETEQGWDWFSVQLDDRSELMLFELRMKNVKAAPYLSGTYIAPDGRAINLKSGDFGLEPLEYWKSPKTGATYPMRWRISVPARHIELQCSTPVPNQELIEKEGVGATYWEGAVRYSGSTAGVGYLEMTGYAK